MAQQPKVDEIAAGGPAKFEGKQQGPTAQKATSEHTRNIHHSQHGNRPIA